MDEKRARVNIFRSQLRIERAAAEEKAKQDAERRRVEQVRAFFVTIFLACLYT
jgi:hypothetical protein